MSKRTTADTVEGAPLEIGRILIPIDFSPASRLALRYGVVLARCFSAELILLHVVDTGSRLDRALGAVAESAHIEQQEEAARMLPALLSEKDRLELKPRLLVELGSVAARIVAASRRERVGLVVMGTRGLGLLRRSLMGSVTEDVLKTVRVPVLTLGHDAGPQQIDRILLAMKLSPGFHTIGLMASHLARRIHASLIAFHAVDVGIEDGAEESTYLGEERAAEAQAKLRELLSGVPGNIVTEARVAEDSISASILRCAGNHDAGLIVLGVRKGKGARHTSLTSVVDRIIREASVPVLSIPIPAAAESMPADANEVETRPIRAA
ncbi:MAG TPA: universal stress protein [Terriglobia bacterium]|nr:universal stress protein [Terriglobia bacterium]